MAVRRSRNEADRLSDMPESLQLRILCCLDARQAVQTMVLSKSWVSTWTCTPVLNFSSHGFRNVEAFDKFVLNALSRRQPVKLKRLTFNHYAKYCPKSLEKAFDYAFSHGVEELEAYIKQPIWPIELHTSSDSLTSLKLASRLGSICSLLIPRSGSFKNLTNLYLEKVLITSLDPFAGFPELDKLRLDCCCLRTEGNALNVRAPKLSEFINFSQQARHVKRCEFTTPKLRYFEWRGSNFPQLITHHDGFPILDKVVIDFNGQCRREQERMMFDDLLMLFNTLRNARSLTLFSPVVHLLTLFPVNGCSPFRELKFLKLDFRYIWYFDYDTRGSDCKLTRKLLKHVPGLKAYLLPESRDAKCSVMVTDNLRPQAIAILKSAFVVN